MNNRNVPKEEEVLNIMITILYCDEFSIKKIINVTPPSQQCTCSNSIVTSRNHGKPFNSCTFTISIFLWLIPVTIFIPHNKKSPLKGRLKLLMISLQTQKTHWEWFNKHPLNKASKSGQSDDRRAFVAAYENHSESNMCKQSVSFEIKLLLTNSGNSLNKPQSLI
jgi:hypothetical protein